MRERNPELPDVAQSFAMYRINRDPKRPLAVRRLLPWIHLRHGNLLLGKTHHLYRIFSKLSSLQTRVFPAAHRPLTAARRHHMPTYPASTHRNVGRCAITPGIPCSPTL